MNTALQNCIDACLNCYQICFRTATTHCLEVGGKHAEPSHLRLMLNCAEICQTTANFMLSESEYHNALCVVCADVCETCAESCAELGMDDCAQACHECMHTCLAMSGISVRPMQGMGGTLMHI